MRFDPLRHHRGPIRLQGYDYSSEGSYFVTMCTKGREGLLGEIVGHEMRLSEVGEIVKQYWLDLPDHFCNVTINEYQVMPNHVHGVVVIWNHRRDLINQIPTGVRNEYFVVQTDFPSMKNPKQTLGKIIRHFKGKATKKIHDAGFCGFAWQPRFHDHIIRDEEDLVRIREYIRENPLNWATDDENP